MPSVGGYAYADRIGPRLAIGGTMGTVVLAAGVYLSLALDLQTDATILCAFGVALVHHDASGSCAQAASRRSAVLPASQTAVRASR